MSARNIASIPLSQDLTFANSAALYAPGDQVGLPLTVTVPQAFLSGNAGPILIMQSLAAVDPDNQKAAFDLVFFRVAPASAGDNNPFAPTALECDQYIGKIKIVGTNWDTYGVRALAELAAIAESMKLGTATPEQLAIVFVNQGAPTYATVSGLRVKLSGIIT